MITFRLFGKFRVTGLEDEAVFLSMAQRERMLLLYFLLHKGEDTPENVLRQLMWEGAPGSASALKSLVARLRRTLYLAHPSLDGCIMARGGVYHWNPACQCSVDVHDFRRVCALFLKKATWSEDADRLFEQIGSLYTGDLAIGFPEKEWLLSIRAQTHAQYVQMGYHAITLLTQSGEYASRRAGRKAVVGAAEEKLEQAVRGVLTKGSPSGPPRVEPTKKAYVFSPRHEDELQAFARQIVQMDQALTADIENIRRTLQEAPPPNEPLVCGYQMFCDTYKFLTRSFPRMGASIFLSMIMLAFPQEAEVDPLLLDSAMQHMLAIMAVRLRRGDTLTRYSPSQYALLLPNVNAETGRIVLERIGNAFRETHFSESLTFDYTLCPLMLSPQVIEERP